MEPTEALQVQDSNDIVYDNYICHYGVGHEADPPGPGSGRFPWGSGENPYQHGYKSLAEMKADMMRNGASEIDVAISLGFKSTGELRKAITIEKNAKMKDESEKVHQLYSEGKSYAEIARELGMSDTNVKKILDLQQKRESKRLDVLVNRLREECDQKRYIHVGAGAEVECGVSETRMAAAVTALMAEGYERYEIKVPQMANPTQNTTAIVLGAPGTTWEEVAKDHTLIQPIQSYFTEDGTVAVGIIRPKSVDSDRILVKFQGQKGPGEFGGYGGEERDGLIQIRRGVPDIALGKSRYAQVRIVVDDKYYMKGMACYADDDQFPPGIDIIYNRPDPPDTPKLEGFKKLETKEDGSVNWDRPFEATILPYKPDGTGGQRYYEDENGNYILSAINKCNQQGGWDTWGRRNSAQLLSKEPESTVKKQLDLTYQDYEEEYARIKSLTNVSLRRLLLEDFADSCDAAASHLTAKAFPRQKKHVIIAIPSLKDDEVFAPNYIHGEWVALARFPYGTYHESPKLRVNNKCKEAIDVIGLDSVDAIGVNKRVLEQMSGGDSDGDFADVIPLKNANVLTSKGLPGLKGFDTNTYKYTEEEIKNGAPIMTSQIKAREMGEASNLLADMQLRGCTEEELVRADKYSMVVIDAKKHKLNWLKAYEDFGIDQLKRTYQPQSNGRYGGTSTLITRANSKVYINERKPGRIKDEETGKSYFAVDPRTGKKIWVDTGRTYKAWEKAPTKADPDRKVLKTKKALVEVTRMDMTDDAMTLLSSQTNPNPKEVHYGNFANKMKAMALEARKEFVNTPKPKVNSEAKKEFKDEIASLKAKVRLVKANAPRELQANIYARALYKALVEQGDYDKEQKKKLRSQCLSKGRKAHHAERPHVDITDREWEAMNSGAVSDNLMTDLFQYTDKDAIKRRALPRDTGGKIKITDSMISLAKTMSNNGYTQAEIADRLGISKSSVSDILK